MPSPTVSRGTPSNEGAGQRAALLLVASAIVITLIGLFPIAAGLVSSPALAVLCRPLQRRLRVHLNPQLSALLMVVLVFIGIVVPGAWIAVVAIHQIPDALTSVHRGAATMRAVSTPFGSVNADTLVARIAPSSFNWLATAIGPAAGNVAHGVLNLSIALLGLYFLLISGDAAWSAVRRRLPFSAGGSDELRTVFGDVTRATVLGAILSAALQGLSIGVGLRLIGNDAPAFWGIVGGFTTLVPVVGNALVWVPAVVVQLIRGDYTAAIIMITLGKLIPSLLDRLTRARISRRLGNTHPMITLLGVLAGVRLIGAAGVLAGPALLRCSFTLVDLYEREYGLPWTRARSSENIDPDS